jgi:hypothetical protein
MVLAPRVVGLEVHLLQPWLLGQSHTLGNEYGRWSQEQEQQGASNLEVEGREPLQAQANSLSLQHA